MPDPGSIPTPEEIPSLKEVSPPKLSAEEQMEQFEEALKESDWGHQPC